MIRNASGANKETGELAGRVFEAYTPQDVNPSGDDTNDRLELTLDSAVLFLGCARFQRQC